jgi:hypothetical protein
MRALTLLLPALSLVAAWPALAAAQTLPPSPTSLVALEDRSAHHHDGLYLRLATGFGTQTQTIAMEGHDPGVTVSGVSTVGELAIGYAVWPGRILGLGSYSGSLVVSSRRLDIDQPMPPAEVLNDVRDFNVFGPFYDHYFDPHGGLHIQGAVGVATVRGVGLSEVRLDPEHVVIGAGLVLGLGYEWWVSDQWGFGLLARVALASTTSDDQDGVHWQHAVAASPAILFTATYN